MDKKYYLIFLVIILFLVIIISSHVQKQIEDDINTTTQNAKEKVYDWSIEIILCKECSSYESETISQSELESIKENFISNFEEGEVVFDKLRNNGFYINATNEAKDKIVDVKIIGAEISSIYYKLIINQEQQKEPQEDEDVYGCSKDRECILVSSGCCGCSSGGPAVAINRDYYDYWTSKLADECKEISCLAVMSNHWTCFAKPRCTDSKCQLVE